MNVIIPIKLTFAEKTGDYEQREKTLEIGRTIPAEKNAITTLFEELGLELKNALESQAYIQLYQEYCSKKKCLHCSFGQQILKE